MKTSIMDPVSPAIFVYTDEVSPLPSDVDDEISAGADRHPSLLRRLCPLVEPVVFVVLAGALFAATELPRGTDPSGSATEHTIRPPTTAQPAVSGTPARHVPVVTPRFIATPFARPGEQITIVGYRDSTLCGASELHFDDVVVMHQIRVTAASKDSSWNEMFMTMEIPSTATPGVHHIQLHGPVPGGAGGPVCGGAPEHQDQLAGTDILIVSEVSSV